MMSLSCGEGHSNRRPWTVRQVTSTRAPPSGMKRRWRLMPIRSRKTEDESFTRPQTFFAEPRNLPLSRWKGVRWERGPEWCGAGVEWSGARHLLGAAEPLSDFVVPAWRRVLGLFGGCLGLGLGLGRGGRRPAPEAYCRSWP